MSQDTRLLVSPQFSLEDIAHVMQSLGYSDLKVERPLDQYGLMGLDYCTLHFTVGKSRRMARVHAHYWSPLGSTTMLSLGYGTEAIAIMSAIADITGGFLQECDADDIYRCFEGEFSPENGLIYHLRDAVLNNRLEANSGDVGLAMAGLQESIEQWNERMKH